MNTGSSPVSSDRYLDAPIFDRLDGEKLAAIAAAASSVEFVAGELLFHRGGAAEWFYVLDRGRIALETFVPGPGSVVIETLGPGDVLGWSWLFPPYRWHLDARAVEDVTATAFDARRVRDACLRDPGLGYELMQRFANVIVERLQFTRLRLADVYSADSRSAGSSSVASDGTTTSAPKPRRRSA